MKGLLLLCATVLICTLVFSFFYAWVNRVEIKTWQDGAYLIINKWTGEQCIFHPDFEVQSKTYDSLIELCDGQLGRINLP